jgi:hypothetical protein
VTYSRQKTTALDRLIAAAFGKATVDLIAQEQSRQMVV